jgi:hypothetical protein
MRSALTGESMVLAENVTCEQPGTYGRQLHLTLSASDIEVVPIRICYGSVIDSWHSIAGSMGHDSFPLNAPSRLSFIRSVRCGNAFQQERVTSRFFSRWIEPGVFGARV